MEEIAVNEIVTDPVYQRSATIAALASALAKAQGAITSAEKDRTNPHFGQKYATLDAVWEACRAPLSENGLAVMQLPQIDGNKVTLVTLLAHGSGEWISARLVMAARDATPQGVGSALTYAKRYGLSAMVGVAPGDDDANAAQGDGNGRHDERRQPPSTNGARAPKAAADEPPAASEPTIPADGIYTPTRLVHLEKDQAGLPIRFGVQTEQLGEGVFLETADKEIARAALDAKKAGRRLVIDWKAIGSRRVIEQIGPVPAEGAAA